MNKKLIKQALIVFALMIGAITLFSALPHAFAATDAISPTDSPSIIANKTGGEGSFRRIFINVINFALGFLGLLGVIMVIYGGVTYVTGAGQDDAITNAKKIILYSILGIIVILLSFAIINTIFEAPTDAEA